MSRTIGTEENSPIDITEGLTADKLDYVKLCNSIWNYVSGYSSESPKAKYQTDILIKVLKDCKPILEAEPIVPKLKRSNVVIFGPVYGEGDSLLTLMSQTAMPTKITYIFLGCYLGHGFAPIECLILLLLLKIRFPKQVYLLKGHHEESLTIDQLQVAEWITIKGMSSKDAEIIVGEIKKTCSYLPSAILLNNKMLCIPGGPGESMRNKSLKDLIDIQRGDRMSVSDKKMLMEAAWSVLMVNDAHKNMHGMPFFTTEQATKYCKDNKILCMIRGRQMVDDGFLNKPRCVITLISAVAYLDNFRNYAAVLKITDNKSAIIRYKMEEGEQESLELVKPGMGRNAIS